MNRRKFFLTGGALFTPRLSGAAPTIGPIVPVAPSNDYETSHAIPHFEWQPAVEPDPEAMASYAIQIAGDPGFKHIVDEDRIAAVITWYVPDKELPPGEYWWRVGVVGADGTRGPWSPARKLKVTPPARRFTIRKGASIEDIHRVLREASAQTPAQVLFESGEFRLRPDVLKVVIDLSGVSDLTIEGNGASIVLMQPGAFVHLANCRRVLVKGLSFDYDPPAYTAGRITSLDPAAGSIEAEILPGHSLPDDFKRYDIDRRGLIVSEKENFAVKRGVQLVFTHAGFERLSGRKFRFRLANPQQMSQLAPGDLYVLDPRWQDEGGGTAFRVCGGEDVVFSQLKVYGAANECLNSFYADFHSILHCRLERKPSRALGVNNGGHNHHNARHGPWVEGCLFENAGDDLCHVSGLVMGATAQPAPDRLILPVSQPFDQFPDGALDIRNGDRLEFFDRSAGNLVGRRRIVAVQRDGTNVEVRLDSAIEGLTLGRIAASHESESRTTQVFNSNRGCNQFVFRHNVCRYGRRVGALAKGVGGLIEDNTFTGLGGGGVEFWNAPFEGLAAVNYVVSGNRIENCGRLAREHAAIWATIFKSGHSRLHKNLLIARNEIHGFAGPAMLLRDSDNVVLRDNQILSGGQNREPIQILNCSRVREQR